jgi:hypothetical protein
MELLLPSNIECCGVAFYNDSKCTYQSCDEEMHQRLFLHTNSFLDQHHSEKFVTTLPGVAVDLASVAPNGVCGWAPLS